MKRIATFLIILAACGTILTGCLGGLYPEAPEQSAETVARQEAHDQERDEAVYDDGEIPSTGKVWQYYYTGIDHPYLTAIADYLSRYDAYFFENKDGMIPCITIAEVDNSDPEDIKVWGIYDINNYTQVDTTLKAESGIRLIGLLHMRKIDQETFQVYDAELADDYDDTTISAICEGHEKAYEVLKTRRETRETRTWYISEWVREYGLEADRYRYYDYTDVLYDPGAEDVPDWFANLPDKDSL